MSKIHGIYGLYQKWRQNHGITDPMTSKSWNNRPMTSKSWNNIKIFMLGHACKSSLFSSWLLHKNIKGKMRIYVTSLIILDYKYYIYHGSYELTYLNQRIRICYKPYPWYIWFVTEMTSKSWNNRSYDVKIME